MGPRGCQIEPRHGSHRPEGIDVLSLVLHERVRGPLQERTRLIGGSGHGGGGIRQGFPTAARGKQRVSIVTIGLTEVNRHGNVQL